MCDDFFSVLFDIQALLKIYLDKSNLLVSFSFNFNIFFYCFAWWNKYINGNWIDFQLNWSLILFGHCKYTNEDKYEELFNGF